ALVRAGFRMILEAQPDIEVVGEAGDGSAAIEAVRPLRPDVVLMDIRVRGADGIEATRRLSEAGVASKIVILTTYDLDEYVFDALAAGASGFLLKDVPPEDLIHGVKVGASGDALLAPSVTRRVIAEFAQGRRNHKSGPPPGVSLTPREVEVLELVARGQSNAEIAESLFVSDNTVKTHVTHLLDKLGLRDRVQAVIYAYEAGIVEPGGS